MNRIQAILLALAVTAVGIFYGRAAFRPDRGRPAASTPAGEPETHLVTPPMAEASRSMVGRDAPPFTLPDEVGATRDLSALLRDGPVVLTFTKVGCPCSEAAQPLFNRMAAAYPGVRMLGVVDAEAGPASLWLRKIDPAYPHVLDPDLKVVRDYGVENSAYVVLIRPPGRIVRHWPGYSTEMLGELSAALAEASGVPPRPVDVSDAPDRLYTGCPYPL